MCAKYAIGVDYGTQSGRSVLVELGTARELATAVKQYTHGVMDEQLPDGTPLPPDWALQHPADYVEVLRETIPAVMRQAGVSPEDVIGIGIDFTACTVLPVYADGRPLCEDEDLKGNPHSYVKLWKHHAAQKYATALNEAAQQRGEAFLARYGGKISSEWLFPKAWQLLEEAPEVYARADRIIEAADWVVWQLCGQETRNSCTAGYKAIYSKKEGYPSRDFLAGLDPRLADTVDEKLSREIAPLGSRAGGLTAEMAETLGLKAGIGVAVGNVDAHVSVPAVGITGPGKMLMIMGTSTCHMLVGEEEKIVPGMCGVVEDGILPGFAGYEAGQSCVGDHFEWFVENCVPAAYLEEAKSKNMGIHQLLTEKAAALKVGESGLVALDWWNGNRSVLVDVDLTGMMLGMTLLTKPEEMYRALIEATAYGTRKIIENYRAHGVAVDELYAAGGIAQKNQLMMQIYADVTGMDIRIGRSTQTPAVGSAMFGAVAAGKAAGGYDSIFEAAADMGRVMDRVYHPIAENAAIYEKLYAEYETLHDYFGRGTNDVMKRLKAIRAAQKQHS
ncbi:MAG: ribulokinase [Eubacteriales bacterium]|nr:ribulokinase [Eubacteriales bacterium]